jgi:ABC-type transporter Mla subunit MlaD
MQTRAPDAGKIALAVAFALSCFALLLFLWVSFGGPTPFSAQSYRFTAYFPEATQLGKESDVRISGVSVGKVKEIALAPPQQRINGRDLTEATIEIEPRFAPVSAQSRAILRQKTLLGETYVELAPGSAGDPVALGDSGSETDAESIPDGGSLGLAQVEEAAQVDEIFNAVDAETRQAARQWAAGTAASVRGRALDINDSLGNLAPFVDDAARITRLVRGQRPEVARLIRDGGAVLEAISRDEADLRGAITGTEATLGGLADANEALAESIQILPTFEQEATLTLARLDDLQRSARPVVRELLPVADDVPPTLRSARRLAPSLRQLFLDLDPVLDAAATGLPATRRLLGGLAPLLDAIDPLLANLNPVIRYLFAYRNIVTAFLTGPPLGVTNTLPQIAGQPAPRHYLRILSYVSRETLSVHPARLDSNRGNAYVQPRGYIDHPSELAFENFDCKNTDYRPDGQDPDDEERRLGDGRSPEVGFEFAPCIRADDFPARFGGARAPFVEADP